jgi:hypothetical protein
MLMAIRTQRKAVGLAQQNFTYRIPLYESLLVFLADSFQPSSWRSRMKKIVLPLGFALAQLLAVSAFAQAAGQADPAGAKAAPSAPATPAQKAAAKAERKAEGAAAAKSDAPQEGMNKSAGTAHKATKEERAAAKAKRKAATAAAVKKGEIKEGEK